MFSPGDTVICVNSTRHPHDEPNLPIQAGKTYPVIAIRECKCGALFANVGFNLPDSLDIVCNCKQRVHDGIWWLSVQRFQKMNPGTSEIEITMTETVTRSVTIKIRQ